MTESLCEIVQHNCNIVDANHAGNFTLCTYLMKMREYCRWDKGYSYAELLSKDEVGEWVSQREQLWDQLDHEQYEPLEINGEMYDPFDTDAINASLLPQGLVYSGGVGARSVPHFFLAKLDATEKLDDYQIVISSEECARDLSSPPAMTLHDKIFIRKESIRRMLWEKMQEWQWHRAENAASRAFSYYDFNNDINGALDEMTEVESQAILLHERGEIETGRQLGSQWREYLSGVTNARLDLILRAAKDYYADTVVMLPELINTGQSASLHFYAANLSPLRKELSPSFMMAYQNWCETSDLSDLQRWVGRGQEHWSSVCKQALHMFRQQAPENQIQLFIEKSIL